MSSSVQSGDNSETFQNESHIDYLPSPQSQPKSESPDYAASQAQQEKPKIKLSRKNKELAELLGHAEWMNSSTHKLGPSDGFLRRRTNTKRQFFTFENDDTKKVVDQKTKPVLNNASTKVLKKSNVTGKKPSKNPVQDNRKQVKKQRDVEQKQGNGSAVTSKKKTVSKEEILSKVFPRQKAMFKEETTFLKNLKYEKMWGFLDELDNVEIPLNGRTFFTVNSSEDQTNIINAGDFVEQYKERYVSLENIPPGKFIVSLDCIVHPFLKEDFLLMRPRDEELDPLYEIGKTMRIVSLMYMPKQYQLEVSNEKEPQNCILGKYARALMEMDCNKVVESIALYNFLILKLQKQNIIQKHIRAKTTFSKAFVHELLCQIYARTVSPLSKRLRNYKAFSNNVYGEILPSFMSEILNKVQATHQSKFIDLGSGVGNCVIQAALEFGCTSYGAEIMEEASTACEAQLQEFKRRAKYYGLNHGEVKFFLRKSFVDHEEIEKLIPAIDLVLVNNYVFQDELNESVGILLRSLKPGSKIISLKSFIKPGHTITSYNATSIAHKLTVEEFDFKPGSVSWTNSGGKYYISTVTEKYQLDVWNDHSLVRTRSYRVGR